MMTDAELLAFVYEQTLHLLLDGPTEITSLRPDDDTQFARALTAAFAMGVEPGAFYEELTPWPVDLADSAALSLPVWIAQRHDQWPDEDPGAVFEYLGVVAFTSGVKSNGKRLVPLRTPRALFLARSWAGASDDANLIAASCALLLLTEELIGRKKLRHEDGEWVFSHTVTDPRSVLWQWCARILDDPLPAVELASEAFATVTGWQYPATKPRAPRTTAWRDDTDPAGVEQYLPVLRKGLALAATARAEGLDVSAIEASSHDERVALAAAVQTLAGPCDVVAAERNENWSFTWATKLLEVLDPPRGRFQPSPAFDPLDSVPNALAIPELFATPEAARAFGSLETSIFTKLEPEKGVTTAAHIVPSAAAVLASREVTGSWWQRAVAHLERFTAYLTGDEDPRYFDDLAAHEGSFPSNDAGLILLTNRDLHGTRNFDTVAALLDAYRANS